MTQRITFTLVFLTGLLLLLSFSRTAVAQSETGATPTPQPETAATPTPQAGLTVQGENIAALGMVDVSANDPNMENVVDGDTATMWTARDVAPQWLSIKFDDFHLVSKIELVITQSEAGLTTHELWLGDDSHTVTPYKRFENVHTEDGQTLELFVEPPRRINRIFLLTRQSTGWVGWYELKVFQAIELTGWQLDETASGFELPVQATHAGDGSGRIFVVEHKGRIRIVKDGVINQEPFLDISDRVQCCGEQGLYNIVFPPTYTDSRHFYVSYTSPTHTMISRFRTTSDPDIADPDSEEVLLTIAQPHPSHNGGSMSFSPKDGYLYIGSGDGGGGGFNWLNPLDPGTLLGKLLRIDVESGGRPYDIPPSNPFVGVDGYRPEIWAMGLRNPWGFAFDGQTGALYIPDAGRTLREEVNFQEAASVGGENYGYSFWEGNYCSWSCNVDNLVYPVSVYDHGQGNCVVVGGAVMSSIFVYADFCKGSVWGLQRQGDRWHSRLLIDAGTAISSIGSDETGNLYATAYALGKVLQLVPKVIAPGAANENGAETEGSDEEKETDTPENAADSEDGEEETGSHESAADGEKR
ncbi:MAG: PQQ-dependent sugar dehydrogenase [Caldilineaceae bacterium]|nr:PQQ-dependent sugar dehydrogenase [Caldilineaceae bacterium]